MIGDILAAWAIGAGAFLLGLLLMAGERDECWVRGYCEGRRDLHRECVRRDLEPDGYEDADGRHYDAPRPLTDAELVERYLHDLDRRP